MRVKDKNYKKKNKKKPVKKQKKSNKSLGKPILSKNKRKKLNKKLRELDETSHFKRKVIEKYAISLNDNLPKSEKWFNSRFIKSSLEIPDLMPNKYFLGYIPDYRSDFYKIIIEVDGNIHDKPEIIEKDKIKQNIYIKAGYTVIRVQAYSESSLKKCFKYLEDLIDSRKPKHLKENTRPWHKSSDVCDSVIISKSDKSIEDQLKALSGVSVDDDKNLYASNNKLISKKQQQLLKELGYKGCINDLNRSLASHIINKLLNNK